MAGRGHTAKEISRLVGATARWVSESLRMYGVHPDPNPFGGRLVTIRVMPDTLLALEAAAQERRIDLQEITRRVVTLVARDRMFDAVLDDGKRRD